MSILNFTIDNYLAFLLVALIAGGVFSYVLGGFLIWMSPLLRFVVYGSVGFGLAVTYEAFWGVGSLIRPDPNAVGILVLWWLLTVLLFCLLGWLLRLRQPASSN